MSWILFSTREITTETPLPASATLSAALFMLHDHATFQSQQPLAIHNETTPAPPADSFVATKALSFCSPGTEPEYRSVTIAVPMGPWTSEIVSQSAFVDTEDGMYVIFQAPMGSSGWSRWSVLKNEEEGKEGLVLREEATLSGYRFLMPFAVGQHKEAHKKYQLNFAKLLEGSKAGKPASDGGDAAST